MQIWREVSLRQRASLWIGKARRTTRLWLNVGVIFASKIEMGVDVEVACRIPVKKPRGFGQGASKAGCMLSRGECHRLISLDLIAVCLSSPASNRAVVLK